MMKTQSPVQRLMWFVDAVLMEERKFIAWSSVHRQDFEQLEQLHHDNVHLHRNTAADQQVLHEHEALLSKHRALRVSHREITRLCRDLMERLRSGDESRVDVPAELERLAGIYERLRGEHTQIQLERERLIREHHRFHLLRSPENATD